MIKVTDKDTNNSETFIYEGLTKTQSNTIRYLVNPKYKTYGDVAEEANVSERSIYNWLNDDRFVEVLNREIKRFTDAENARVWKSLIREAGKGNVQAIKLYFELKNKYKDRKEITGKDGGPIEIDAKNELAAAINRIAERKER